MHFKLYIVCLIIYKFNVYVLNILCQITINVLSIQVLVSDFSYYLEYANYLFYTFNLMAMPNVLYGTYRRRKLE